MTKVRNIKLQSEAELVNRFVDLAIEQDRALFRDEIARVNDLFDRMRAVEEELKSRSGDQRRKLVELYKHPNMHVRLKAAKATLAVEPMAARKMIEEIADSAWYPQAGEAGMTLWSLDEGIFKPS